MSCDPDSRVKPPRYTRSTVPPAAANPSVNPAVRSSEVTTPSPAASTIASR